MKKHGAKGFIVFLIFQWAIGHPQPAMGAASWEDEKEEWERISSTRFYKDPGYAAKLSLNFWPVDNGHFYVGEVGKGVWYSVGETMALVAVATAYLNAQSRSKEDIKPIWTDAMVGAAAGGGVFYIGLKVLSAFSSAACARRYNAEQEKRFGKSQQGFRWDLAPDGVRLTRRWGGDDR